MKVFSLNGEKAINLDQLGAIELKSIAVQAFEI